jgi:DNA-binding MarR family transcriptional regulator
MTHTSQPSEIRRLLEQAGMIQSPYDLDLLVFLHRHPRTLLTSEQLAGFVGYPLKDIAKALDTFLEAGLLERTAQKSTHAARMFLLLLDGPQGGGVKRLLELASTRQGRQKILEALDGSDSCAKQQLGASPSLKLVKSG